MSKRKKGIKKSAGANNKIDTQSEISIGTEQLNEVASRSTKNIFSQMLSRSK